MFSCVIDKEIIFLYNIANWMHIMMGMVVEVSDHVPVRIAKLIEETGQRGAQTDRWKSFSGPRPGQEIVCDELELQRKQETALNGSTCNVTERFKRQSRNECVIPRPALLRTRILKIYSR